MNLELLKIIAEFVAFVFSCRNNKNFFAYVISSYLWYRSPTYANLCFTILHTHFIVFITIRTHFVFFRNYPKILNSITIFLMDRLKIRQLLFDFDKAG